jgi:hypothetical protein
LIMLHCTYCRVFCCVAHLKVCICCLVLKLHARMSCASVKKFVVGCVLNTSCWFHLELAHLYTPVQPHIDNNAEQFDRMHLNVPAASH